KTIVKETTQEQSTSVNSTPEQNTSGESNPEESAMEQNSSLEKNTSEQSAREQMSSKQSIPEKRTPGNHPVLLTSPLVYTPQHVLWKLPNLLWKPGNLVNSSSLEKSKTGYAGLETGKTDSTTPEMIASTSSAGSSGIQQRLSAEEQAQDPLGKAKKKREQDNDG
ncbi:Hypothetical predicted protein, partial [Paramuricea clavata]